MFTAAAAAAAAASHFAFPHFRTKGRNRTRGYNSSIAMNMQGCLGHRKSVELNKATINAQGWLRHHQNAEWNNLNSRIAKFQQ